MRSNLFVMFGRFFGPRAPSALILCGLVACGGREGAAPPPMPPAPTSLGGALYEVICNRLAAAHDGADVSGAASRAICSGGQAPAESASPHLWALHQQRQRLVAAIDSAVPDELKQPLRGLLTAILPLHDDGTLRAQANEAVAALDRLMGDDDVLGGLARLGRRQGYTVAHAKLMRAVLAHPPMGELMAAWATAVHDQPEAWATLRAGLYEALAHHADDWADLLADLLGDLHGPLLGTADGPAAAGAANLTVVRRDKRGLALPAHTGAIEAPFVDRDHDGLADVDAQGRFVDRYGQPLMLPTPFARAGVADSRDAYAPALRADGSPWWRYVPAQHSPLGQALDVLAQQGGNGTPLATVQAGLAALAADAGDAHRQQLWLSVQGADRLARRLWPLRQPLATLGLELLQHHEAALTAILQSLQGEAAGHQIPGQTPAQALVPLLQDLVQWLGAVSAQEGLLEDVLLALAHPDSALLGPELAAQMQHVDAIDFDPEAINGPVRGALVTPTSPAQPTSTFARLLALAQGVHHRGLCSLALEEPMPEYGPCALFEVPDVGVFYVNSLAGVATLTLRVAEDDFFFPEQFEGIVAEAPDKSEMEAFTGIDGFAKVPNACHEDACVNHLTFNVAPKAASRLLFALYDERVPDGSPFAQCRAAVQQVTPRMLSADGRPFDEAFAGTVFAWELGNFPQGVRPLAQAFAAHGAQAQLLDLLTILHRHWGPLLAQDEGFERRLADKLADVRALAASGKLLADLTQAPLGLEVSPVQLLAGVLRAAVATAEDGPSPVALWLEAYALGAQAEPPAQPPGASAPWALGALKLKPVLQALLQQVAAGPAQGLSDAPTWPSPALWLERPELQAAAKLLSTALAQPGAADAARSMWRRLLVDEQEVTVTALADSLQLIEDLPGTAPLLSAVARHLLTADGLLPQSLNVLRRLAGPQGLDGERALGRLMASLFALPQGSGDGAAQEAPVEALVDIFLQLSRAQVGSTAPMEPEDIAASLAALRQFLADEQHGLMRLLTLVDGRRGTLAPLGARP